MVGMKRASDSGDGCWKAKDEHWTACKNHGEYLTKKNSEVAYTQFIRHHCSFTVRRSLSFDLLPTSQLSCPEYLGCNHIARPVYLSIWGATVLRDHSIWAFEGQLYCKTKQICTERTFVVKRSWHMCSNHFNKQMSFCPNHLSLVTNELWPKCSLKIFWVWISGDALTHCYALNPCNLCKFDIFAFSFKLYGAIHCEVRWCCIMYIWSQSSVF